MSQHHIVATCINAIFDHDSHIAVKAMKELLNDGRDIGTSMLRTAILCPGHNAMFYQQLYNFWENLNLPLLKPHPREVLASVCSDFTADNLVKQLKLMTAARGVSLETHLPGFDSVEQGLLDKNSSIYETEGNFIVILLSEHWLDKYLGFGSVVAKSEIQRVKDLIESLLDSVLRNSQAKILINTFYLGAWPMGSSCIETSDLMGRQLVINELNQLLRERANNRVIICDLETAIHQGGGAQAIGSRSYLLAKMAFENKGLLHVCRELSSTIADLCGQTHRACALDWDNTLWGGVIAELGPYDVVCGFDSPEANGYRFFQHSVKGLGSTGTLLAAVSRNSPDVVNLIDENPEMPLNSSDFASLQVNYVPKSESIAAASKELGFGTEYMFFVDDSTFELAEVLLAHPHIDIMRAESDPEYTLQRFSEYRVFSKARLEDSDITRSRDARNLRKQREYNLTFRSNEDFLDNINIKLSVESLKDANRARVVQLINKTNQFNISTRRRDEHELNDLVEKGSEVWAFSYEDDFGPQGIISVIIVSDEGQNKFIDTWLMSCRVLNRTVEYAVFEWVSKKYQETDIHSEFIPSAKNGLVEDLLEKVGFQSSSDGDESQSWLYRHEGRSFPKHFIKDIGTKE